MIVSVFTDASHCPHKKVGGWGCWLKSNRGQHEAGGVLRDRMQDSNTAELAAVANGLFIAKTSGLMMSGDTVILQSDSLHAVKVVRGYIKPRTIRQTQILEMILKIVEQSNIFLDIRHVKGHNRASGQRRSHANHYADRIARRHMVRARNGGQ